MLCGLIFCLLFPFYSLRGPLNWDTLRAPAVGQEMESFCVSSRWAGFMGLFLEWRHQPGSTPCASLSPVVCFIQGLPQEAFESFLARNLFGSLWTWLDSSLSLSFSGHAHSVDLCARPVISLFSFPLPWDPWILSYDLATWKHLLTAQPLDSKRMFSCLFNLKIIHFHYKRYK